MRKKFVDENVRIGLAASCVAVGLMAVAGRVAFASPVVVDPANMGNWVFQQDSGTTGAGSFVPGPGTAPLGQGSAQLSITDSASSEILFQYGIDDGTPLSDFTALSYDSYVVSATTAFQSPMLQFNVAINSSAMGYEGRLAFEPYYTNTITPGTWQSWNAITGGADWWFSDTTVFDNGCNINDPCTWDQLLLDYPDVEIYDAGGGFGFKIGSSWGNFVGDVDDFTTTLNGVTTTYDFDPNPVPEPASLALFGMALAGFGALRRRRKVA